jgi:hypothetical protein
MTKENFQFAGKSIFLCNYNEVYSNKYYVGGVSGKWRYITIGKVLCLLWQHCRRPWSFTREPCSFDSGRSGFVWVRRVWNGSADPKPRQMRGAFRHTISQRKRWTSSGNSQTNCCCHNGVETLISFLCVAREKLQRGTHPFRFVIVR